jgi:large subunit ribosomal protein L4
MSTPEEPSELAQESAQDETPESASDDVSTEEPQQAEAKPKPARRRPAPKAKAPAEDAAPEDAAPQDAAPEDAAPEQAEAEDAKAEDAVEETEAEAPAQAPAKRAPAKPKRAPAVAGFSLVDADLPGDIFDVQVNVPLIHQVVVAQQAAARQGTHSTKTRGDVRGGGRKPYRQKGTGRARQGSIRAPQFAGGGIVHGPVPRSYAQKTPKKMKAAALRGALSDRARHGLVQVVDGFVDGAEPKTRDALAVLNLATGGKVSHNVLVVADASDQATWKSLRNAVGVHLIDPGQLNTYDVLVSDRVVFTSAALASFVARASSAGINGREDAQL